MISRLIRRALLQALLSAALSAQPAAAAGPPDLEQIVAERAAAHGVSAAWVSATIGCESSWNTRAVGAAGELGLAQLKPGGELPSFFARGYSDPFDAYESIDYLALRFSEGGSGAWTCS